MSTDLSKLKIVRIGHTLSFSELRTIGEVILAAFKGAIKSYDLLHHSIPIGASEIEASLLIRILDETIGGHILGITDMDLVHHDGYDTHIFGGKDETRDIAVLSRKRLAPPAQSQQNLEYELTGTRTLKEALHEEGHNFGLTHHYSLVRARNGSYCPMTKGDFNRYGEIGYLKAIVDGRGFEFCDDCVRSIRGRLR